MTAAHGAGTQVADKAGVKLNQISQWCRGIKPSGPNRTKLEKGVGIISTWWDEPPVDADTTGDAA